MKKTIIVLITLLSATFAIAQTTPTDAHQQKTLFGDPTHIGWWVSPDFMYTQYDGNDVFQGGLSGGVIFNHCFSVGLGGYGIMNSYNLQYENVYPDNTAYLYGGYGGLKLEYRLSSASVVHVAFPLLIGGGSLVYSKDGEGNTGPYDDDDYFTDDFFVLEPGVMMGVNLLKFMRFDIGATYRFASDVDLPVAGSNMMDGFSGVVSLKFGKF